MTSNLKRAFLIGYAYAFGVLYSRYNCLTMDDTESGKVQPREHGRYVNEGKGYARGGTETKESVNRLWGKEHTGVKGKGALDLLLKERSGHVKAAFHRDDIGDIDLIWGDEKRGLAHIIKERSRQPVDLQRFFEALPDVIQNGELAFNEKKGNFEIYKDRAVAVISATRDGSGTKFLLTSYRTRPRK